MKRHLAYLVALKKKGRACNAHPRIMERIQNNIKNTTAKLLAQGTRKSGEAINDAAIAFGCSVKTLNDCNDTTNGYLAKKNKKKLKVG